MTRARRILLNWVPAGVGFNLLAAAFVAASGGRVGFPSGPLPLALLALVLCVVSVFLAQRCAATRDATAAHRRLFMSLGAIVIGALLWGVFAMIYLVPALMLRFDGSGLLAEAGVAAAALAGDACALVLLYRATRDERICEGRCTCCGYVLLAWQCVCPECGTGVHSANASRAATGSGGPPCPTVKCG